MEGWTTKKLAEVVDLKRGFDLPTHSRRPGSYPVLSSGVTAGWHDEGPVKGPGLVIGRATNLGQPTWSQSDFWPLNTTLYAADFHGNEPRWVFHLFESMDLTGFDSGSVQPMLNRNYIAQLPILVPPVGEQRAIAEVLGGLDDKIAANTKLAETADDYLSTEFARLVAAFPRTQLLGAVADVNAATIKPVAGGSLRYVDIASVGVGHYDFPDVTPWDGAPSRARRVLRLGDTIWSTVRPNRRSHALILSDDPLLVGSTGLAVLSPRNVGFAYLYEVTKRPEFTAYLETVAEGSAYPAVRADKFLAAPIPMLPDEPREQFEETASAIRLHVESLVEENRTLAATRDALLPQLMSGKLRVKDIEHTMGEMV